MDENECGQIEKIGGIVGATTFAALGVTAAVSGPTAPIVFTALTGVGHLIGSKMFKSVCKDNSQGTVQGTLIQKALQSGDYKVVEGVFNNSQHAAPDILIRKALQSGDVEIYGY